MATPKGAVSGGLVQNPQLLAGAIRSVLRNNDIGGAQVVVGLPGRGAVSRSFEIPAMRQDEMRPVVAGEMEHYRMVPSGHSTFDFMRLGAQDSDEKRVHVLVMAADSRVVDRYREALRLAGRQMVALEPTAAGSFRGARGSAGSDSCAVIAIGARTTELGVFQNGNLCYTRQMDVGKLQLLGGDLPPQAEEARMPETIDHAPDPGLSAIGQDDDGTLPLVAGPTEDVGSLSYEIQRSLDFYYRETPGAARVERAVLCADVEALPELRQQLEDSLGLPVALCEPFADFSHHGRQLTSEESSRLGASLAPAVGLALHGLGETSGVDCLDLSDTGTEGRLAKLAPKWLTAALTVSIIFVVGSLIASMVIGRALREKQQALALAKAELARVEAIEQEKMQAAERAQEAITLVELRGLPWSDILFQVSEFMPRGAWVTDVRAGAGNRLSLEGNAMSADSVATLMEFLTRSPLFRNPNMASITKARTGKRTVVKYRIGVGVVPPSKALAQAQISPAAERGAR
jgi:type IV pilus assembly protein PilM